MISAQVTTIGKLMGAAFIMLAAAFVPSFVSAKEKTWTIGIEGLCDVFDVTHVGADGFRVKANAASCDSALGGGRLVKDRDLGKAVNVGLIMDQFTDFDYFVTFSYPFKTGGTANVYEASGDFFVQLYSLHYTVENSGMVSLQHGTSLAASTYAHRN